MLHRYFRRERVRMRIQENPIREAIERLVEHLDRRGHRASTVQSYVQAAEHFGQWLGTRSPGPSVVDLETVRAFLSEHLPECRCVAPAPRYVSNTRPALRHLLRATGKHSAVNAPIRAATPAEQLVSEYVDHLKVNCGLAPETRHYRTRYAREFLESRFPKGRIRLSRLKPEDVTRFIAGYAAKCKRSSTQVAASSVRSFLRFLQMRGLCGEHLVRAVPWIPQWKLSGLPRAMTDEQLLGFLDSFDRSTATGRRDYAMALCMVELGLRVSEVVVIELSDVDWRNGRVQIRSAKERQSRQLPLSRQIGQAIASYLKSGRPPSSCRRMFLRHTVPVGSPVSRELVRGVMRRAYKRSGGGANWTGTHILRHTAATRLHQHGASLKEIADLLGHRSIDTSAIYTKVNLPMLRSVAVPWPEVQS